MSRWLKHIAFVLAISLALGACSRMGLAYRNLDVIIPWTLSDYLDMNGEQKSWFNDRLKEHLSWHCTTQMPGYLDWLDRLQDMIATNQVTDATLQAPRARVNMSTKAMCLIQRGLIQRDMGESLRKPGFWSCFSCERRTSPAVQPISRMCVRP